MFQMSTIKNLYKYTKVPLVNLVTMQDAINDLKPKYKEAVRTMLQGLSGEVIDRFQIMVDRLSVFQLDSMHSAL